MAASLENTIVRNIYDVAFQVSPIIFQGGIAASVPGGLLPVVALLGGLGLIQGAIAGHVSINDFSFFFRPMPGSTLITQSVGMYPFANQRVAANATIQEPLTVSLHMIAPVKVPGGYITKLAQISALQALFEKHNNAGGTYVVLTPAKIYDTCLMLSMTDITGGETKQDQVAFQIDFIQPLISQTSLANALSSLMSKVTNGQPTTGSLAGNIGSTLGMPSMPSAPSIPGLSSFIPGIPS